MLTYDCDDIIQISKEFGVDAQIWSRGHSNTKN